MFVFEQFEKNEVIFKQGSQGDKFYLIVEGSVKVTAIRQKKLYILSLLKAGAWFGEIALLRDTPRTATIECEEASMLLSLNKDMFQKFLKIAPELSEHFKSLMNHRTANTLKLLPLFERVRENRPWSKLEMVAAMFLYEQAEAKTVLYKIGDQPTKFYLTVSGGVDITASTTDGKPVSLRSTKKWGHFGDLDILKNRTRTTNATTNQKSVFLVLKRRAFLEFLSFTPELKSYFTKTTHGRSKSMTLKQVQISFTERTPTLEQKQLNKIAEEIVGHAKDKENNDNGVQVKQNGRKDQQDVKATVELTVSNNNTA